jgi:hypothetical protein
LVKQNHKFIFSWFLRIYEKEFFNARPLVLSWKDSDTIQVKN